MRLWSIHPQYLDSKGLVALWRETLLAKKVLQNRTRGYRHHPQLERFKDLPKPVAAINIYLRGIFNEARRRNYKFDPRKIGPGIKSLQIPVTSGQLAYEFNHLLQKLKVRDPALYRQLKGIKAIQPHPLFNRISGPVAEWEVT